MVKHHPTNVIICNPNEGLRTISPYKDQFMLISELKKINEALDDEIWGKAIQKMLNQF